MAGFFWKHYLLFVGLVLFWKIFSGAEANAANACDKHYVSAINIEGNQRTNGYIVKKLMKLDVPGCYSIEFIEAAIQRLKNLGIFVDVDYQFESSSGRLLIHVNERWTTIPILKFASGGGVNQVIAGLYDPNVFGHYIEAGGQVERLGETNSGVLWVKHPHVFGKFSLFLQVWDINRIRLKYEQDRIDPEIKMGFLHHRKKQFVELSRNYSDDLVVGLRFEVHEDEFSERYIDDEVRKKNVLNPVPQNTLTHLSAVKVAFGQMNQHIHLFDGFQSTVDYEYASSKTPEVKDFYSLRVSTNYASIFAGENQIAHRFLAGATDTNVLQYWYYLGGLDRIRGYSDNRFAGRYYILSNLEYRHPVFRKKSYIVQASGFYDVLFSDESMAKLKDSDGESTGFGLRFILPQIYRFVARVDFAIPLKKRDEVPISFGVQQYF